MVRSREEERSGAPQLKLYLSFYGIHTFWADLKKKSCAVTVACDISYLKEAVNCGWQPWLNVKKCVCLMPRCGGVCHHIVPSKPV